MCIRDSTAFSYVRAAAATATSVMFAILLALAPSWAYGSGPTGPVMTASEVSAPSSSEGVSAPVNPSP